MRTFIALCFLLVGCGVPKPDTSVEFEISVQQPASGYAIDFECPHSFTGPTLKDAETTWTVRLDAWDQVNPTWALVRRSTEGEHPVIDRFVFDPREFNMSGPRQPNDIERLLIKFWYGPGLEDGSETFRASTIVIDTRNGESIRTNIGY
jgi:hypothetical protein